MKITEMALRASRLTYLAAVIILVAGIATFLNFPSQEEPSVTIRDAVVAVLNPGMPAERVEQLIARPIEERLRELAEVKRVTTTVRALHHLMRHAERVHSRAQLLDKVWGDHVYIEERTVDVHVKRLREALGEAAVMVETVRGAGYRVTAQGQA